MQIENRFKKIIKRHEELSSALATEAFGENFSKISKEYADLSEIVGEIEALHGYQSSLSAVSEMLSEDNTQEMESMIKGEIFELKEKIKNQEDKLKILLIPKDADDERNAILEIRAGTGGDEAGLFAGDLFRMYQKYSAIKGWKFEILSLSETGIGSVKEVIVSVIGKGVFEKLKFESGVHRVQRVPETESGGRVHTSTSTVAVLPEAEEIDVTIDEKDLMIDVFRASGAGGQHVNTTDSAVRITHIPTGIIVSQQDERSQHKNKAKGMKILRAKIYELEREKKAAERSENRKSQVGTGERSERIRTYNFPQGRVSDHRINLTLYKINQILEGEALEEIINSLIINDQTEKLMGND